MREPKFVRRSVSGATPTLKVSESKDVTVKHVPRPHQYGIAKPVQFHCVPLIDMLSPS
jgi:hypothetical protein